MALAGGYVVQFETCAMRFRISVVTISVTIGSAAGLRVSLAEKGSASWLVSQSATMFPRASMHCGGGGGCTRGGWGLVNGSCARQRPTGAHLEPLVRDEAPFVLFEVLRPEISRSARRAGDTSTDAMHPRT